jgi:hypothetical protein
MRIVTNDVRLSLSLSIFVFAASFVVVVGTGVVVVDDVGSVGGSIVDPSTYVLFCFLIVLILITGCGLLVDGLDVDENGIGGPMGREWMSGRTGNLFGGGSKPL